MIEAVAAVQALGLPQDQKSVLLALADVADGYWVARCPMERLSAVTGLSPRKAWAVIRRLEEAGLLRRRGCLVAAGHVECVLTPDAHSINRIHRFADSAPKEHRQGSSPSGQDSVTTRVSATEGDIHTIHTIHNVGSSPGSILFNYNSNSSFNLNSNGTGTANRSRTSKKERLANAQRVVVALAERHGWDLSRRFLRRQVSIATAMMSSGWTAERILEVGMSVPGLQGLQYLPASTEAAGEASRRAQEASRILEAVRGRVLGGGA